VPFPPNFDRVWDESQPPDTQLANLLGLDIRNLKGDIRERISLLSGTFANRPTPEANWGGAGFGVIYVTTDTSQIFQWNGAAWVDITTSFPARPTVGSVFTNPAGAITLPIWVAPYACTVVAVKGFRSAGTGATVNAQKNAVLNHLAADLSLTLNTTWQDGGAVQNTAYAIGDYLSLLVTGVTGPVGQVNIQVNFTRP